MRRSLAIASLFSLVACNAILGIEDLHDPGPITTLDAGDAAPVTQPDASTDASTDVRVDAPLEAGPPPDCTLAKDFGAPVPVDSLNTTDDEGSARLSDDELTVYFDAHIGGDWKLMMATRTDRHLDFGTPAEIPGVNSADNEYSPTLSADELEIFFERRVANVTSIFESKRTNRTETFPTPSPISNVNTGNYTANPFTRGDAKEIWFVTADEAAPLMYVATLGGSGYTTAIVNEANIGHAQQAPVISADGLLLLFATDKLVGGVSKGLDIHLATRTEVSKTFGAPIRANVLDSDQNDKPTWLSLDGCRLYMASNRPNANDHSGGQDIYIATRPH